MIEHKYNYKNTIRLVCIVLCIYQSNITSCIIINLQRVVHKQ
eukprot:UN05761